MMSVDKIVSDDLAALAADSRRQRRSAQELLQAALGGARRDAAVPVIRINWGLAAVHAADVFAARIARAAAGGVMLLCAVGVLVALYDPRLDRAPGTPLPWWAWPLDGNAGLIAALIAALAAGARVVAGGLAWRWFEERWRRAVAGPGRDGDAAAALRPRVARLLDAAAVALPLAGATCALLVVGVLAWTVGQDRCTIFWFDEPEAGSLFTDRVRDLTIGMAIVVAAAVVLGRACARRVRWVAGLLERGRMAWLGAALAMIAIRLAVVHDLRPYSWRDGPALLASSPLRTALTAAGGLGALLLAARVALGRWACELWTIGVELISRSGERRSGGWRSDGERRSIDGERHSGERQATGGELILGNGERQPVGWGADGEPRSMSGEPYAAELQPADSELVSLAGALRSRAARAAAGGVAAMLAAGLTVALHNPRGITNGWPRGSWIRWLVSDHFTVVAAVAALVLAAMPVAAALAGRRLARQIGRLRPDDPRRLALARQRVRRLDAVSLGLAVAGGAALALVIAIVGLTLGGNHEDFFWRHGARLDGVLRHVRREVVAAVAVCFTAGLALGEALACPRRARRLACGLRLLARPAVIAAGAALGAIATVVWMRLDFGVNDISAAAADLPSTALQSGLTAALTGAVLVVASGLSLRLRRGEHERTGLDAVAPGDAPVPGRAP